MEAFTIGRVSAMARRGWLMDEHRARRDRTFTPVRDGYEMIAWESEIAMCRAMGRGVASGKDTAAHRFDLIATPAPAAPAKVAPRW
jgi:hypothetical protein